LIVAPDLKTKTRLTIHNEGREVIRKVIQIFNEEMPSGNLKCHTENSNACATTVTRIYEATIHLLRKLMCKPSQKRLKSPVERNANPVLK
jgi:hypothetical protein